MSSRRLNCRQASYGARSRCAWTQASRKRVRASSLGRRPLRVDAQQPGRHVERFGVDLGVPEQAAGGLGQPHEGPVRQPAVLRYRQAGVGLVGAGPQPPVEPGATAVDGPLLGDLVDGDQEFGAPGRRGPGQPQGVDEDPGERGRREDTGGVPGDRAQLRVLGDRPPMAGQQLLERLVRAFLSQGLSDLSGQRLVRYAEQSAGVRGIRMRGFLQREFPSAFAPPGKVRTNAPARDAATWGEVRPGRR